MHEEHGPFLVRERERVCGLLRIEVSPLSAGREAKTGEACVERPLGFGEPRCTAEDVDSGERHEAIRLARDEVGEEVVLGLRLVELPLRSLEIGEGMGQHRQLDPRLGLPLEVAVHVE